MTTANNSDELIVHLFRSEFTKVTAVLCRYFGFNNIGISEDIASDTFLKAMEHWSQFGIPLNPKAWLYVVAKNKAKDYLKQQSYQSQRASLELLPPTENLADKEIDFSDKNISDSQLVMLFIVCNPALSSENQIAVALQLLCGFSIEEIADSFLTKPDTIKKRVQRAKSKLQEKTLDFSLLKKSDITERTGSVMRVIYLLFNEGYYSKSDNNVIKKDLCLEALRLAMLLKDSELTNSSTVSALIALLSYQSSRLEARNGDGTELILYENQNCDKWEKSLIEFGHQHLIEALSNKEVSKYHFEATIAYWHTQPDSSKKWENILILYDELLKIEKTPFISLNRIFVFSKVFGKVSAIEELKQLYALNDVNYYSLLGYLNSEVDVTLSRYSLKRALELSKSEREKTIIEKRISQLINSCNTRP